MRMANSKPATSKPRRQTKPAAKSGPGRSRSGGRQAKPSSDASAPKPDTSEASAGIVKRAAAKAKGPAVAVGAAAAGVAGARALRSRMGHKTILGVPVPRSLGGASLPDLDVRSMAKTIGEASQWFAETSKAVSRDLERAGNQAERIGRMLG
jgi:hypothetical protein